LIKKTLKLGRDIDQKQIIMVSIDHKNHWEGQHQWSYTSSRTLRQDEPEAGKSAGKVKHTERLCKSSADPWLMS
jgi:hypothetical protein